MATAMFQGSVQGSSHASSPLVSVVLADPESSLRSIVFASREGLAVAHKVDEAFPQQATKVTINQDAVAPGDFVVRSVIAGSRRKFEILAMDDRGVGFRRLLEMVPDVSRTFASQKLIEFANGETIIQLPEAITVATFKAK